MSRLFLILLLVFSLSHTYYGQSASNMSDKDNLALQKLWLISDLKALETKATDLQQPLGCAAALSELADAAWTLDEEWAKKLLNDAFLLTLPDEDEQKKLRERPVGAEPQIPSSTNRAAMRIRNRILQIASRNKTFINQLLQLATDRLGSYEGHLNNSELAKEAFNQGEKEAAKRFILQAISSDPTQGTVALVINEIASRDREFADELITQYLELLQSAPLSYENRSLLRVQIFLDNLIFFPSALGGQVSQPGANVFRAYSYFVIDRVKKIQQYDPNNLQRARTLLLSAWQPLRKFAPELISEFGVLETKTRKPGGEAFYPESFEEIYQKANEKREQKTRESNQPNILEINSAINKGDFDKARKMIDKLDDGSQKTQLLELVNTEEALSLTKKGDLVRAEVLAERLNKSISMLKVYPAIIKVCVERKDQTCVTTLGYQAIKQLKKADNTPLLPLKDTPSSFVTKANSNLIDNMGKLALAVVPIDETLALIILDDMVDAANKRNVETEKGLVGFDTEIFRKLAFKNEMRVKQAAINLQDPLRQIITLATIYQVKAKTLTDKSKKKKTD